MRVALRDPQFEAIVVDQEVEPVGASLGFHVVEHEPVAHVSPFVAVDAQRSSGSPPKRA